jgi:hypothetical protein
VKSGCAEALSPGRNVIAQKNEPQFNAREESYGVRGVLWHLLKYKQEFDWKAFENEEAKMKRKKLARLQNVAASLNFQLVPLP